MVVGFIGMGNMVAAIVGGILDAGMLEPSNIIVSRRNREELDRYGAKFGVETTTDNREVAKRANILFLAVKPQFLAEVIEEIKPIVSENQLIVSIAAGKTIEWICGEFGKYLKVIRCMPNTPALVKEGCSAICKNSLVTDTEIGFIVTLFGSIGKAYVVTENMMDVVVGVSGSSPAYVFLFIEAMADAAVAEGMPRAQAYEFAAQAVLGSAKMVLETGKHPGQLKDMVCSPGGTTIQAVRVLEEKGMRSAVMEGMIACINRARNL